MKMILMGTGTSHGIPVIGCSCKVCQSTDKKDKRYRCSAYIENENDFGSEFSSTNIVIDTGPEFRIQALETKIKRLDAIFLTHSHADHCHGLDDIRIFSHSKSDNSEETKGDGLSIFANDETIEDLKLRFAYVFNPRAFGGGLPKFNLLSCEKYNSENPIKIGSVEIVPIPLIHGVFSVSGWILKGKNSNNSIAYLTDCSKITEESLLKILEFNFGNKRIKHLIIDALKEESHVSHCSFSEALSYADRIGAENTWLTHICHKKSHIEIQNYLNEILPNYENLSKIVKNGGIVSPAFDTLELIAE